MVFRHEAIAAGRRARLQGLGGGGGLDRNLDSRVEIFATAVKDVKGLLRIWARRLRRQLSGRRLRVPDMTYRAQLLHGAAERQDLQVAAKHAGDCKHAFYASDQ